MGNHRSANGHVGCLNMFLELKATSKIQAQTLSQKFYFPLKACRNGHNEGRRVKDGRCKVCFSAKRKRYNSKWEHRRIVARLTAEIASCWFEILLVVLMRTRERLLWRLRKILKHVRALKVRSSRRKTPEQRRASRKRNHAAVRRRERAAEHLRRARELEVGGRYTAKDVERLLWRQKHRCYWCKVSIKNRYHVDHVMPLTKGGSNGAENICLACPTCNLSKHNKTPLEWAGVLL